MGTGTCGRRFRRVFFSLMSGVIYEIFAYQEFFAWSVATTPGGGGYSHTLPIRVCAAQRGRDFKAPGLERGIHFRGVF